MVVTTAVSVLSFHVAFQVPAKDGVGVADAVGCAVVSAGVAGAAAGVVVGVAVAAVPEDDVHPAAIIKMQAMPARSTKTVRFII
jgi:hypothetical protein